MTAPSIQEPGDWIEWSGGSEAPFAQGPLYDRRYRSGLEQYGVPSTRWDEEFWPLFWGHDGTRDDIIAFRIVS